MTEFAPHSDPDRLTARQREVLKLVAAGRTNAEIAGALGIGFETAKMHVGDILDRLGVDSREEAAQIWREHQRPAARIGRVLSGFALTPLQRVGGMVAGVATVAAVGLVFVALARDDREPGAPPAAAVSTATSAPTVELIGTRWDLLAIDGQPVVSFESAAYLQLRDEPHVSEPGLSGGGYSGCNWFGFAYSLAPNQLLTSGGGQSQRACRDPANDTEVRFLTTLVSGSLEIEQVGDRLTLTASDGTQLEFVARTEGDPDGLLTSTTWHLESIDGRWESAYQPLTFEFADDGSFSTTTGCGSLRGTYARIGFAMTVVVYGETPADCLEPNRTIDADLRAALANTESYLVDLSVLSLIYGGTGGVTLRKVEP